MPDLGIGFLDIDPVPGFYGSAYWEHFRKLDETDMSRRLTMARMRLVERHWGGDVVDIGIGGGAFVCATNALGWDVNPYALQWLAMNDRLARMDRDEPVRAVTMWDSIEHMRNPSDILRNVTRWVFISTPTYSSANAARGSKHFKPGEHLWYFTERGLIHYMDAHGFELRESNTMECGIGREGICSFAFERV